MSLAGKHVHVAMLTAGRLLLWLQLALTASLFCLPIDSWYFPPLPPVLLVIQVVWLPAFRVRKLKHKN